MISTTPTPRSAAHNAALAAPRSALPEPAFTAAPALRTARATPFLLTSSLS